MYQRTLREWRRLSPTLRWAVLGVTAVAMIAASVLLNQSRAGQQLVSLFGERQLSQSELAQVQAVFANQGLGRYELRERQVLVPRSQRNTYLAAVVKAGAAPAELNASQQEAFGKSNPFESLQQRDARLEFALEKDLAVCIRKMAGIEDASVHIDRATVGAGLRREQRLNAIVVVQPSQPLSLQAICGIRQLVAAAKVQLAPQDVTVTDLSTGISHEGSDQQLLARHRASDYPRRKRECERHWNEKLRSVLDFIPELRVATSVEFAPESSSGEASAVEFSSLSPGETPAEISVSIGIPEDYLRQIWRSRQAEGGRRGTQPTADALAVIEEETRQRITLVISRLLPSDPQAAGEHITIATFHDGTRHAGDLGQGWNPPWWSWVFAVAAVACCLATIALRGLAGDMRGRPSSSAASTPATALKLVGHPGHPPSPSVAPSPKGSTKPPSPFASEEVTAGELAERIRENPQGVADLLREWVDRAG